MQQITSFPRKDIPRASELIRMMGDFVGKPFDPVLFSEARSAQVCKDKRKNWINKKNPSRKKKKIGRLRW